MSGRKIAKFVIGFRFALKRSNQLALEELFVSAKKHTAEAVYAAPVLPFEILLPSILLIENKYVIRFSTSRY
jgi:hypothetical protein